MPWPIRLKWWHWDLLGPYPFDWRIFQGVTENDYPDQLVQVGFPGVYCCRVVLAVIRDNPAAFIFSYDGETELPEREFWFGFIRLEAVRAFKIRSAYAGLPARYTLLFLR
jgi:hypothetical protein